MILHAAHRLKADTTAEANTWSVEGDDYDQLRAKILEAVPDDSVLLYVRRD